MLSFKGGHSTENKLELSHLCEHVLLGFNYSLNGQEKPNLYMGKMQADARTKEDLMEFTFCVLDCNELNEKIQILKNAINSVIIPKQALEKEKKTILDELFQSGTDAEYVGEVKKQFKNLTPQDIYNYIKDNLTADNLSILVLGDLEKKKTINIFNEFISSIPEKGKTFVQSPQMAELSKRLNLKGMRNLAGGLRPRQSHAGVTVRAIFNQNTSTQTENEKMMIQLLISYLDNFRLGIKKVLREDKRLVYRTGAWNEEDSFGVKAVCREENAEQVKILMQEYLKSLYESGISLNDFETIKREKQRYFLSRPIRILEYVQRNILDEYLKTNNQHLDETYQLAFLEGNQVDKNKSVINQADKNIKTLSQIKYSEFCDFIKQFLQTTEFSTKSNAQTKNV